MSLQCDRKRPVCEKCISTGRTCEGYNRYPIFVNRTVEGLQRRAALEETRPASESGPSVVGGRRGVVERAQPLQRPSSRPPVPHVTSPRSNESQFHALFWEEYAPSTGAVGRPSQFSVWMMEAMNLPDPTPALRHSLLALSVTRRGRKAKNDDLLVQGRGFYGQALQSLQQALYDPRLMWHDDTLAACRTLMIYEVHAFQSRGKQH